MEAPATFSLEGSSAMSHPSQKFNSDPCLPAALTLVLLLTVLALPAAQAQTYTVLHNFTGGSDGANPEAGLAIDRAGKLYGTTFRGGTGFGTIFRLAHSGSGWVFSPLYLFAGRDGGNDGAGPTASLTIGPDGSLYGTTAYGGAHGEGDVCNGSRNGYTGCGTVFSLRPPATACKTALCPWNETILYRFGGTFDGSFPGGDVILDQAGSIYGTTESGGLYACEVFLCGTVFQLTPSSGSWNETVLWNFGQDNDGWLPESGLIFDQGGNLYGTTGLGGDQCLGQVSGCGTVFELTPTNGSWTETVLHVFTGDIDGAFADAGLIFGNGGNLYGATSGGGPGSGGTVFELTPSNGGWVPAVLYSFSGSLRAGPHARLIMDSSGNLYGTTLADGANGKGSVFKLTFSGGTWTYTSLHDFTGGIDGGYPYSDLVFDTNGNLYGTASAGGSNNDGVVFEVTP